MKNEPLNKKELISLIYDSIAAKLDFKGNLIDIERQVENVIHLFLIFKKDNRCELCNKPNWEKLAQSLEFNLPIEFCNNRCGYCKGQRMERQYIYSPSSETWTKII